MHVYKREKDRDACTRYLYVNKDGNWVVGKIAGDDSYYLIQHKDRYDGQTHYTPSKTKQWEYWKDGWKEDDKTLKVFPCYKG